MMALGFAIAKSTNIDQHLHVQGMLAELIQYHRILPRLPAGAEADAAPNAQGVMTPAAMPLWTVRMMFPKMFVRMCEIIQTLGAGGLVAVPSYAGAGGPVWARRGDVFPGGQRRLAHRGSSCSGWRSMPRCRRSPAGSSFMSGTIPATRCGSPACCIRCTIVIYTCSASGNCSTIWRRGSMPVRMVRGSGRGWQRDSEGLE